MHKILIIEPNQSIAKNIVQVLSDYECDVVRSAADALVGASKQNYSAMICEMSLSGHSGFEFLYEFRSYSDWIDVPIVIYTTVQLNSEVVQSRTWEALNIYEYLYKPNTTLAALKSSIEKATATLEVA